MCQWANFANSLTFHDSSDYLSFQAHITHAILTVLITNCQLQSHQNLS